MADKKQVGPRVEKDLAELYDWFVRYKNDGKRRGKLGDEAREAFLLQMGHYFMRNPEAFRALREDEDVSHLVRIIENDAIPIVEDAILASPMGSSHDDGNEKVLERLGRLEDLMFALLRAERGESGSSPSREGEDFEGRRSTNSHMTLGGSL